MSFLVVVWWLAVTEVGRSGGGERERERENCRREERESMRFAKVRMRAW